MESNELDLTKQETNKIHFISNRYHLTKESPSCPKPIGRTLPTWYKEASVYVMNKMTNEPWLNPEDGQKIPSWKACAPLLDAMSSGYALRTPCDIEFFENNGRISAKALDKNSQDFISERAEMADFATPMGYDKHHFAWWVDWGVIVPTGYSALYTQPMNRFELPFFNTTGIIDNDKVNLLGQVPFFVFKGWTGTLPAGTPYLQLFPFKRENWESEIVIENPHKIYDKNIQNSQKYRVAGGGVYKNNVWEKRSYK
jgi:hypothetical protein